MDNKRINTLIDRYFEGETSLQEEAQLRRYFSQDEVPAELEKYQTLFQYFSGEAQAELGQDFDERLFQQIEALDKKQPISAQAKIRSLHFYLVRVAAVVVLALGVWWTVQHHLPKAAAEETAAVDWSKYEVKDPQQAFKLTAAALHKASAELNQGANMAAKEVDNLKEITRFLK
ncbi:MAG TPA: hypothetical protein PKA00_21065 [Saprospiraceae bacterium]|nr:hypothetical protein [Saprospiraceae bacterium]HMQ85414.1 hypothetical protein [Saprospiraceae bacterium]